MSMLTLFQFLYDFPSFFPIYLLFSPFFKKFFLFYFHHLRNILRWQCIHTPSILHILRFQSNLCHLDLIFYVIFIHSLRFPLILTFVFFSIFCLNRRSTLITVEKSDSFVSYSFSKFIVKHSKKKGTKRVWTDFFRVHVFRKLCVSTSICILHFPYHGWYLCRIFHFSVTDLTMLSTRNSDVFIFYA